jgi:hypothetical protein
MNRCHDELDCNLEAKGLFLSNWHNWGMVSIGFGWAIQAIKVNMSIKIV